MPPVSTALSSNPEFSRLARALAAHPTLPRPWSGVVFRSASPAYAGSRDLLSGEGVRRYGGRWNPPGSLAAVYASTTPETALAEALAQFRRYGIPDREAMPRVLTALEARLSRLLDLTDGSVRRLLRVSRRRMAGEPWRALQERGREAVTQAIGRAAFEAGVEGLLTPSAAARKGVNLVVFPEALRPGSSLAVAQKEVPAN
jgi:RES domain-containing protein